MKLSLNSLKLIKAEEHFYILRLYFTISKNIIWKL